MSLRSLGSAKTHLTPFVLASLVFASLFTPTTFSDGIDLAEEYPATLDWVDGSPARQWTCEADDVWKISSFKFSFGSTFSLETGPGYVLFGKHLTNVVWAVVLPDEPGKIVKASNGEGEGVLSVWLRFNPALVDTLFPKDSVVEQGPESEILWANRIYRHKINSSWQSGNMPVIPWKHSLVIDLQTTEGPRRFFMVDTKEGRVKYEPHFEQRALGQVQAISSSDAHLAFDAVWEAFDREYSMFVVKPQVDWLKLKEEYRPQLEGALTSYEVGAVISGMLTHLEDLHVSVRVGGEYLQGFRRDRPLNASWNAVGSYVPGLVDTRKDFSWGITTENIGYVNIYRLGHPELPKLFDSILEELRDTDGLIMDLRFNGGGDELLARDIAGRFADKEYVYSLNQYRNGPNHSDLGPKLERIVKPRGPFRYASPVVVLHGQRTFSSAESLLLMLAQCPQVTTVGDRSAGSSANPRRVQTEGGITVNLPRWLDMDPDGKPIDSGGVAPDVQVDAAPEEFTADNDPVLERAFRLLRERMEAPE